MSEQAPKVRDEEPELSDEALEDVAGGCQIDQTLPPYIVPTLPEYGAL